jgi:hypothetical protein
MSSGVAIRLRRGSAGTLWLVLFVVFWVMPFGCTAFLSSQRCSRSVPKQTSPIQQIAAKVGQQEEEGKQRGDFLEKALRLRQEATDLETKLRAEQEGKPQRNTPEGTKADILVCKSIDDSVWTFQYRFSNEPESDNEEEAEGKPRDFYRGKLTVKFRADGFTDIVSQEPGEPSKALSIVKAWGWDTETTSEDKKEYLLFSADIKLPDNGGEERFYLQARQEREGDNIVLEEGTVTVKRDVNNKSSPGFWGVFSGKGILAQFRYVGDFVSKPSRIPE